MQDLLNEEEFIREKPYNPWKSFRLFYAIAVAEVLIMTLIYKLFESYDSVTYIALAIIYNLLPVVTSILMFYYRKENFLVPVQVKLLGILGFTFSFALVNFLIRIIFMFGFDSWRGYLDVILIQLVSIAIFWVAVTILSSVIILIIAARRKKKFKLKTA